MTPGGWPEVLPFDAPREDKSICLIWLISVMNAENFISIAEFMAASCGAENTAVGVDKAGCGSGGGVVTGGWYG